MAAIEFFTEDGALQCSSDFFSHFCKYVGRAATVALPSRRGDYRSYVRLQLPADLTSQAVVAVRMDGAYIAAFMGNQGEPGYRRYASDAPGNSLFTYYIFDTIENLTAVGAPVEFWDEATGKLKFSSAYFPMIILRTADQVASYDYPDYKLATAQGKFGGARYSGEPICIRGGVPVIDDGEGCDSYRYQVEGYIYGGFVANNGTRAGMAALLWDNATINASGAPPPDWFTQGQVMVIDVSDIPV